MNPEHQAQAQRLQELRRRLETNYQHQTESHGESRASGSGSGAGNAVATSAVPRDPMIYPGLYSPSGFDVMGILIRVHQRPNPTIELGNIDSGAALVLCDASHPDLPIIYCSEAFVNLSGYTLSEIQGHNCRFLQYPPSNYSNSERKTVERFNHEGRRELREKMRDWKEACVSLVNFTKAGRRFENLLTVVPIWWEGEGGGNNGNWYLVGFQADAATVYR